MERLPDGVLENAIGCYETMQQIEDGSVDVLQQVTLRLLKELKEYKDTNLTPEQLLEIDKMYAEKCREVVELREKQTPYKPDEYTGTAWNGVGVCKCGVIFMDRTTNYCGNCGQRLDWGD